MEIPIGTDIENELHCSAPQAIRCESPSYPPHDTQMLLGGIVRLSLRIQTVQTVDDFTRNMTLLYICSTIFLAMSSSTYRAGVLPKARSLWIHGSKAMLWRKSGYSNGIMIGVFDAVCAREYFQLFNRGEIFGTDTTDMYITCPDVRYSRKCGVFY